MSYFLKFRPAVAFFVLAAASGSVKAQSPAPWPTRTGQGVRGEWEAYALPGSLARDGALASHGGEGDPSFMGLPPQRLDIAPAACGASAWWALDADRQTLLLRVRLAGSPLTAEAAQDGVPDPVGGVGALPFADGAWNFLFDLAGDGWRDVVLGIDGSTGGTARDITDADAAFPNPTSYPLHAGDDVRLFTDDQSGTQSIVEPAMAAGRVTSPNQLVWHVESAIQAAAGPGGPPPDGFTWDMGFTRVQWWQDDPTWGSGWLLDAQLPLSVLRTGVGRAQVLAWTPISWIAATSLSPTLPVQRDVALPGAYRPGDHVPLPFGEILQPGLGRRQAPLVGAGSVLGENCGLRLDVAVIVVDALRANPASTFGGNATPAVVDTIASVLFESHADDDCNGLDDEPTGWLPLAVIPGLGSNPDQDGMADVDGIPRPGQVDGAWGVAWDQSAMPDGCYLLRATARDDGGLGAQRTILWHRLDRSGSCRTREAAQIGTFADALRREPDGAFSHSPSSEVFAGASGLPPHVGSTVAFYFPSGQVAAASDVTADAVGNVEASMTLVGVHPLGTWRAAVFEEGIPPSPFDPLNPRLLGSTTFLVDVDADADGVTDGEEALAGSNPFVGDTDGDTLGDAEELSLGADGVHTGVRDADTDDDGLSDSDEAALHADPSRADTDGDGISDGVEAGVTSLVPDPDGAGPNVGTNPARFVADADPGTTTDAGAPDTDRGGVMDGLEDLDHNGRLDAGETDPLLRGDDVDGDHDGAPDGVEMALGLNRARPDTDGDGLLDGEELLPASDSFITSPLDADSDDDGLDDALDGRLADPTRADADGDGIQDGTEMGLRAGVPDPDGWGPLLGTDVTRFVRDEDAATHTDLSRADSDGGGAPDGFEDANRNGRVDAGECDPLAAGDDASCANADADGDTLTDVDEARLGTNPNSADSDGDTVSDPGELALGTDPRDMDSDDDGLLDPAEREFHGTDPLNADTDGDGVQDGTEARINFHYDDPDGPGPGLGTAFTFRLDQDVLSTTSPVTPDTDHGGAADGNEDLNGNGVLDIGETSPGAPGDDTDGDGDGLPDQCEPTVGTDPGNPDTDGDGLLDGEERIPGADGFVSDPLDADTDDDGLSDGAEVARDLDPSRWDTDGDGLSDGVEVGNRAAIADPDGAGPLHGTRSERFVPDANGRADTDPLLFDTDGGGAPDGLEDINGNGMLDGVEPRPWRGHALDDVDSDRDGIPDVNETAATRFVADRDGDGLLDGEEIVPGADRFITDPDDADTDDDGVNDGKEVLYHLDPRNPDTDGDGVDDGTELGITTPVADPDGAGPLRGTNVAAFTPDANPATTTDPLWRDQDDGGAPDGLEDLNGNGRVDAGESNPLNAADDTDTDADGIPDALEGALGLSPSDPDTDADGASDGEELIPLADGVVTDPLDQDTDDDGLMDGEESRVYRTNPALRDTDGDLVQDGTEAGVANALGDTGPGFQRDSDSATTTSPTDADTDEGGSWDGVEDQDQDGKQDPAETDPNLTADDASRDDDADGLTLTQERAAGTKPSVADTDGDALSDGAEVLTRLTDPLDGDTDDDGIKDGEEVVAGADGAVTDPLDWDDDDDGVSDGVELGYTSGFADADGQGPLKGTDPAKFKADADPATRTNPRLADHDAGGVPDGNEDLNGNGRRDAGETDPRSAADDGDADNDDIPNAIEAALGLNPAAADTDGDTIIDGSERIEGADGSVTDPLDRDTDDDGLADGNELSVRLTSPVKADTDGDGILDGTEVGVLAGIADPDGTGPVLATDSRVFVPDADAGTTTNARVADSDAGGIRDGNEDVDFDGRVDAGERNPNLLADDVGVDLDGDGIADALEPALGLDPARRDTDGDGIADGEERIPGNDGFTTIPLDADTDDDGIPDGDEAALGLDPTLRDTDRDGIADGVEIAWVAFVPDPDGDGPLLGTDRSRWTPDADPTTRTNARVRDTDGGGLADGAEDSDANGRRDAGEMDPLSGADDLAADADRDGVADAREPALGLDPARADTDGDGLKDGEEMLPSGAWPETDPLDADTDDDGVSDGAERSAHLDAVRPDTDGDGISDGVERGAVVGVADPDGAGPLRGTAVLAFVADADPLTRTDPLSRDTDRGGVLDGAEDMNGNGRIDAGETNPGSAADDVDADGDGLGAAAEARLGTNTALADTDADGLSDGEEALPGKDDLRTNPLDRDTDDDGLGDGAEQPLGLRADRADTDDDGLPDGLEMGLVLGLEDPDGGGPLAGTDSGVFRPDADPSTRTDPRTADTDGGGVRDGLEEGVPDGAMQELETDPRLGWGFDDVDTDGDGVADIAEAARGLAPGLWDTDGDGLSDGEELIRGLDGRVTDPLDADTDDDGLSDGEEVATLDLQPLQRDSDGDGLADGLELGRVSGIRDPDRGGMAHGTDDRAFGDHDPATTTQPEIADTDGGLIQDGNEDRSRDGKLDAGELDPLTPSDDLAADADADGLPDAWERWLGCSSTRFDSDGDTLSDGEETVPGADGRVSLPRDADTDDDGLSDGEEVQLFGTDPLDPDTDGDGIWDGVEMGRTARIPDPDGRGPASGTNPFVLRRDADPLTTTSPLDPDTDEGGVRDGDEDLNANGRVDPGECNPRDPGDDAACRWPDSDADGLNDPREAALGTDPLNPDTDGDDLLDGEEVRAGTSPFDADTDDDGIGDGEEAWPGIDGRVTNPLSRDTDGDGIWDGVEVGLLVGMPDPDGVGPLLGTDVLVFRPDADILSTTDPCERDTDGGGVPDGNEDSSRNGGYGLYESNPMDGADDADRDGDLLADIAEQAFRADPDNPDTDGDTLPDGQEVMPGDDGAITAADDVDSDDDSLGDGVEVRISGTDPSRADTDNDGLPDGLELGVVAPIPDPDGAGPLKGTDPGQFTTDADPASLTDPLDPDTDDGGVTDGLEDGNRDGRIDVGETDPLHEGDDADADADGLPDELETLYGTDPLNPDTDGDGIQDGEETEPGADGLILDPLDLDTDDDGIGDGAPEASFGTDASRADTDSDGVDDGTELGFVAGVADPDGAGPLKGTDPSLFVRDADPSTTTDPLDWDTDNGTASDGQEDLNGNGLREPRETDPLFAGDDVDADGDGLRNSTEVFLGTDMWDVDTDDDGVGDYEEVKLGVDNIMTDPLDIDTDDDGLSDLEEPGNGALDPNNPDTDGDGLQDGLELGRTTPLADPDGAGPLSGTNPLVFTPDTEPSTTTNPLNHDTDAGSVWDGVEDADHDGHRDPLETDPNVGSDDLDVDFDDDGLSNAVEVAAGLDPLDADSDDDGVLDAADGLLDSDGDTLIDGLDPDSDNDGLFDGTESGVTTPSADTNVARGFFIPDADPGTTTNPRVADTDGGTVADGAEDLDHNGRVDAGEKDPNDPTDDVPIIPVDTDGDGLLDDVELQFGLDPRDVDSDDDGVLDMADGLLDSDGDTLIDGLDPDSDNDGILDGTESGVTTPSADTNVARGFFVPDVDPATTTDMRRVDTDNGGLPDGAEDRNFNGRVDAGETDPNDPTDDIANPCSPLPPPEVDGAPGYGLRVARVGSDVLITWTDVAASIPDPCMLYHVYAATDRAPRVRADYALLSTRGAASFAHVGAAGDGRMYSYLVVAWTPDSGEGPWGYAFDGVNDIAR